MKKNKEIDTNIIEIKQEIKNLTNIIVPLRETVENLLNLIDKDKVTVIHTYDRMSCIPHHYYTITYFYHDQIQKCVIDVGQIEAWKDISSKDVKYHILKNSPNTILVKIDGTGTYLIEKSSRTAIKADEVSDS